MFLRLVRIMSFRSCALAENHERSSRANSQAAMWKEHFADDVVSKMADGHCAITYTPQDVRRILTSGIGSRATVCSAQQR